MTSPTIANSPPAVLSQMKSMLVQQFDSGVTDDILEQLSEQDARRLGELIGAKQTAQIQAFLKAKVPTLANILVKRLADLRQYYTGKPQ